MDRRWLWAVGALMAAAMLAAALVTFPDVGRGIALDYLVPPLVVYLALKLAGGSRGMAGWVQLDARLVVGGIWVWAGLLKLPDPAASVESVRAYELLPASMVEPVGYLLPPLEVVLGVALLLGVLTRGAAALSVLVLAAFVAGISWAWAQGLQIDCGCFGDGGADPDAELEYPWEIARDLGLIALSAFLVVARERRWALDSVLFRATPPETMDDDDPDRTEGTPA